METVGIRALKQNASAVVAEVRRGKSVVITDRGQPAALLTPVPASRRETLETAGLVRPASRSIQDLPHPEPSDVSLSEVLRDMREDERY